MKLVNQTDYLAMKFGDEGAVRILCESGFDGIDYSMFRMSDDSNVLNTPGYKNHINELISIADFYGVSFEQSHAPFPSCREGDGEYNSKMFEKLKRSIEVAGRLNAKVCVVHPVPFKSNQFEKNMELYHGLEPVAAEFGVKIALENMWSVAKIDGKDKIVPSVCGISGEFNDYYDALDPANFTCCLDLGHCGLAGEDAAEAILNMGSSRIGALHIHDNDFIHDSHTMPYTMKMDWDSILHALGKIDYKGNFTYEADHFMLGFPADLLHACMKFMHDIGRGMMKKIEKYRVEQ